MGERTLASESTLLKYSNPVLIVNKDGKQETFKPEPPKGTATTSKDLSIEYHKETQDILNCILPPREWEENGQQWRQMVSSEPATRADVLKLGEQLDMRLQQRQARETGICAIRRELYTQAFDEIIRQVTINCAERGLLLLRVRDEAKMTIAAYQSLYESSIAFGLRKALLSERGKQELEEALAKLTDQKQELIKEVGDLKAKYECLERRAAEVQDAETKKHQEEISYYKKTNHQLKSQLEAIITPKK